MIKESEEVVLELGEALALWNIFVIKPAVMDKNCALLSNNSIDIIAAKTVSADVNHSMLINNVVEVSITFFYLYFISRKKGLSSIKSK